MFGAGWGELAGFMKRFQRASRATGLKPDDQRTASSWLVAFAQTLTACGGLIGDQVRRGLAMPLSWHQPSFSPKSLFPLPLPSSLPCPRRGRARLRHKRRSVMFPWLDCWVMILNLMYSGAALQCVALLAWYRTTPLVDMFESAAG